MRINSLIVLSLMLSCVVLVHTKKNKNRKKKDRKQAPKWKSGSMPSDGFLVDSVAAGTNYTLDCKASGRPKPTVTWFHNSNEIFADHRKEMKKGGTLKIRNLEDDDQGNYTCIASNKYGQLDWTVSLDVHVKVWPLIVDGPQNITQTVGSNVAFRCRVLNDPTATISWQKVSEGNKNSPPGYLDHGDDPTVLTLNNIQKDDEAEYTCQAGNRDGFHKTKAWLHVIQPVVIPDVNTIDENRDFDKGSDIDPYQPRNVDNDKGPINPGGFDLLEGGNGGDWVADKDLYYITTKRPRNRNKGNRKNKDRKNKKKKKNKKNSDSSKKRKDKTNVDPAWSYDGFDSFNKGRERDDMELSNNRNDRNNLEDPHSVWTDRPDKSNIQTTAPKTKLTTRQPFDAMEEEREEMYEVQTPKVWIYHSQGTTTKGKPDGRANQGKKRPTKADTQGNKQDGEVEGSIPSWTIYTIVGAVGGVILLIGLVAITLTLCCHKERDEGAYKGSTPV